MRPAEIGVRVRRKLVETVDRFLLPLRRHTGPLVVIGAPDRAGGSPSLEPPCWPDPGWTAAGSTIDSTDRSALIQRADRILDHRITLFDLDDCPLGVRIDWNREYKVHRQVPLRFAPDLDYRDFNVAGDAKFLWEPSRHLHLVVLGRAYRVSGDERYPIEAVQQICDWIDQCPYGRGAQWRSPLELAIRVINWVLTLELLRPSAALTPSVMRRVRRSVWRHLWEIDRSYSRFSSANNHLIGEAAGVMIGCTYFPEFRDAPRWYDRAHRILSDEVVTQTYEDGGNVEQAFGYHLFVLEFLVLCGMASRASGLPFPREYWRRLETMFEFVATMNEAGGPMPNYGDADDGHVFDVGQAEARLEPYLAIGAALFERSDFKALAGDHTESVYWLLGQSGLDRYRALESCTKSDLHQTAAPTESLTAKGLPQSGLYLLRTGRRGQPDCISVTFDCGPHGFGPLFAHAHADALSICMKAFGQDVLVDPGTYDYFTHPEWRSYLRSTRAHNTIEIDGFEQSRSGGPFLWLTKANARCTRFDEQADHQVVAGEHDGYKRLDDPVLHCREVTLNALSRTLTVIDRLCCESTHSIAMHWHLGESCTPERLDDHRLEIKLPGGSVVVEMDRRLEVESVFGSEKPIMGWVSRGYHRKSPTHTIIGRAAAEGDLTLTTTFTLQPVRLPGCLDRASTAAAGRVASVR